MILNRAISLILILLSLTYCGQDYNSNSFDASKYGSSGIDTSSPAGLRLAAAFSVIETNCISCHTGYHNSYSLYTTDALWTGSGLVTAGDFSGSLLITKLQNYGGNMPQGGSQLSETDITTLQTWIEAL